MGIAPRRRRKPKPPTPIDPGGQWISYREQAQLQAENHTDAENAAARLRTAQLLAGGHGAIDWGELCRLWEQK